MSKFILFRRVTLNQIIVLLLINFVLSVSIHAQNASCGEPQREFLYDRDGDGIKEDTVRFEGCALLNFQYDGTNKKVIVHYTTTNGLASDRLRDLDVDGDGTNDLTASEIAERVAEYTKDAWIKFRDYGNPDPMGRNDMNVVVYDMKPGLAGWCCTSDRYSLDAPHTISSMLNDTMTVKSTCAHEMWHASRWKAGMGGWITEGSASNMTDHFHLPLDVGSYEYMGRINGYFNSGYRNTLTAANYEGALWWKYFMERVGSTTSEPNRGVDAMAEFWDNIDSDGLTTFDNIIKANLPGENLESIWLDFTVANFAKDYTGVASEYQYIDENQTSAPDYRAPGNLEQDIVITSTNNGVTKVSNIPPWSVQYLKIRPDTSVSLLNFDVRQDSNNKIAYTLLLIKSGGLVKEVQKNTRNFVHSEVNDDYDEAILCITSFSEIVNHRYTINNVNPTVNIIAPLTSQPVKAGDPASPDKILVKVEALSPIGGGTPLAGLSSSDFNMEIGGLSVPDSNIIASSFLQGQYWFVLRPPVQPTNGRKNLEVTVNGISVGDTEVNSVDFNPRGTFDNVIVGDRSGSMGDFNKLTAAEDAARLYVDSWKAGDKIGVVSFNSDATVDMTLRNWTSSSRTLAFNKINAWNDGGGTAIGDGLLSGLNELKSRGDTAHDWSMIVLSDGLETADKRISDFLAEFEKRKKDGDKNPSVHTVALGPDSDRPNMQRLASKTGGTYHFASEPGPTPVSFNLTAQPIVSNPNNINNELAEVYRVISEEISTEQQIYSTFGSLSSSKADIHNIYVDQGASEGTFTVNWYPNAPDSILLFDPNDVEIQPTSTDKTHYVYKVKSPKSGNWKIRLRCDPIIILSSANTSGRSCSNYLVEAALNSQLTADLYLGNSLDRRNIGFPIPIMVALTDEKPILNSTVNAIIKRPDEQTRSIKLYDDGNHNDGSANDGIYGNLFRQTALEGTYTVKVAISGTSNVGSNFNRKLSGAFDLQKTQDEDGDGLPDDWEVLVGLDNKTKDQNDDNDNDGISNLDEFLRGLDPNNSDTDNGGQDDGSEIANGSDPLNPLDDQIQCMLNFSVQNYLQGRGHGDFENLNAAILNFSVKPSYHHMIIWRKMSASNNWIIIEGNAPPTGQYIDNNVNLGSSYQYKIQAVDNSGRRSCIRGPREIMMEEDPIPPLGYLEINEGAIATQSLDVTLFINASEDAYEMRISNDGNFNNSNWTGFKPSSNWKLDPLTAPNSTAWVFVQLRDQHGNLSEVFADSIKYEKKSNAWCYFVWLLIILALILIIWYFLKRRGS